jgi:hypothetical protein
MNGLAAHVASFQQNGAELSPATCCGPRIKISSLFAVTFRFRRRSPGRTARSRNCKGPSFALKARWANAWLVLGTSKVLPDATFTVSRAPSHEDSHGILLKDPSRLAAYQI